MTKLDFVAQQWRESKGRPAQITCECGTRAPIRFLFRCLYCGQFYCQSCAEIHFGMTRAEYRAKHPLEAGQ